MCKYILLSFLILTGFVFAQTGVIGGVITDRKSGEALSGANIHFKESKTGTHSDENGEFNIQNVAAGKYHLLVSYLGYVESEIEVVVKADSMVRLAVALEPTALSGKEVTVIATRAVVGETPATFSTLSSEEIKTRYYAQDIPVMLSNLPSSTFYSESGNGIGYTYLSIRGFDQRRISVMINGVPQNDPEDHNVYWVDFPDFLGNVNDIQVQRGAGNAFYGPPAIGGSINIVTTGFSPERKIDFYSGYGTYNTKKYSLAYNSGLLANKYIIMARASQIKSDGYRDKSWVDFKSYFLGVARFDQKSRIQLQFYGGPIKDGLAYTGLPALVNNNTKLRTRNYSYWEVDSLGNLVSTVMRRNDEVENFTQPHIELITSYQLSNRLTLNSTLFGIYGYGYFDYDGSWAPMSYFRITPAFGFDITTAPDTTYASEILIRAYVDNKQFGWFPNLTWKTKHFDAVIGSELRYHRSLHWGRIQKGSEDLPQAISGNYSGRNYIGTRRYYEYKGGKDIISPYLNVNYQFNKKLNGMVSLQFANLRYKLYDEKFIGTRFDINYHFLNPRIGLNYLLDANTNLFASFSRTQREPRLKNLYDAAEASTPDSWGAVVPEFETNPDGSYHFDAPFVRPEKLNDIELGLSHRKNDYYINLNLYYMDFRDEIISNGQVDRFGQPKTGNADRTLHAGIELDGKIDLLSKISLSGNAAYSINELKRYSIFSTADNGNTIETKLDGNQIAGFPNFLANSSIAYHSGQLTASVSIKHVGKQYIDNFENEDTVVEPYSIFNGIIGYDVGSHVGLRELSIQFHVQNIFDKLYLAYGRSNSLFPTGEYFPGSERQLFINLKATL